MTRGATIRAAAGALSLIALLACRSAPRLDSPPAAAKGTQGTREASDAAQRPLAIQVLPPDPLSGLAGDSPPQWTPEQRMARVWADSVLLTLSLRDKVAQLVWPWILGDYVAEGSPEWARVLRYVTNDRVGGVIVSVGAPLDIAAKINALQRSSALPLLVSADLETGAGFRARAGYFVPNAIDLGGATNFPLQMALGASADSSLAYAMGRVTALEARALGIHVAFGPVLDVNNNPANPVIGARSFAEDPHLAARLGTAMIRGMQDHGVLSTGKHFPGHGDTETNSHLSLASVTAPRERLDSIELAPFRAAIAAGVGAIMTFHGDFPALDSARVPATLSRRVMSGILRDELRFTGLLVTDAMDMKGVIDRYGAVEACKRAVEAGNDLLLMPADVPGAIDAVVAGVSEGRYDEARLNRSVTRILMLKHLFGLASHRTVDVEAVRKVVGTATHTALADTIAMRGFVLARDSARLVPVAGTNRRPRVLSVTFARRADLAAGTTFNAELRSTASTLRTAYVNADDSEPHYSRILEEARASDIVVVGSYVNVTSETATAAAPQAFIGFMNALLESRTKVVLVSYGTPYLLQQVPRVGTYAIAWGGSPASQRAAARALTGAAPITARLPISLPPLLPIGAGERR